LPLHVLLIHVLHFHVLHFQRPRKGCRFFANALSINVLFTYYLRQEVLRSVVFVGWLVGSFVRSLTSGQRFDLLADSRRAGGGHWAVVRAGDQHHSGVAGA